MSLQKFLDGPYNKIRAFLYTPAGLIMTIPEVRNIFDSTEGNENYLMLAVGVYLTARGVTGAINMAKQKGDLENKLDD